MSNIRDASPASRKFYEISLFGSRFAIDTDRPDVIETFFVSFYGDAHNAMAAPSKNSERNLFRLSVNHSHPGKIKQNSIAEPIPIPEPGMQLFLEWEPESGAALFNVPPAPESRVTQIVCAAASNFIYLTLMSAGVFFFHASSAARADGAVMFCGPNGSGKSTVMRAALARGARYLSDDACATAKNDCGAVCVYPGREAVEIADLSTDEISLLREKGFRPSPHEKFLSPPAAGLPSPIRAVYFLAGMEGIPAVRPLSAREAAVRLMRLHRMPMTDRACEELMRMSGDIAEQAPAYEFELGADAESGCRAVMEHVESII